MRFGRRAGTTATYAALVAERHLWLVLDGPGTVSVRGAQVPVRPDEQHGHRGLCLDLAGLPTGRRDVLVDGRPLAAPAVRPAPAGATTALERDDAGHLRVVRHAVAEPPEEQVTVVALRLLGESVEVDLHAPPGTTTAHLLDGDDRLVVTLALRERTLVVGPGDLAGAEPGGRLRVVVDTPAGRRPVRRAANALADPGHGALLPAVHPHGAEEARARLRWSPEATLVVRVLGEHAR